MIQLLIVNTNPNLTGGVGSGVGLHFLTTLIILAKCLAQPSMRTFMLRHSLTRRILMVFPVWILYQILTSTFPAISALKTTTFLSFVIIVLTLTRWSFNRNRFELFRWYIGSTVFIILASAVLLPIEIGYSFEGKLFNGIMNHPNSIGVCIGIGTSYILVIALSRSQVSWELIVIAAIGLIEIYFSSARGGLVVVIGSVFIYMAIILRSPKLGSGRHLVPRLLMVLVLFGGIFVQSSSVRDEFLRFFVKMNTQEEETDMLTLFESSRGGGIDVHLNLYKEKPWTGHGFQIVNVWTDNGFDSDTGQEGYGLIQEKFISYDPLFRKVPISAPVESGFMYTSIIAENGILGSLVAYGLIIGLIVGGIRRNGRAEMVLIIGFFVSNLSEATFFSVSGSGGWGWIMLGLGCAAVTKQRATNGILRSPSQRDVSRIMNTASAKE